LELGTFATSCARFFLNVSKLRALFFYQGLGQSLLLRPWIAQYVVSEFRRALDMGGAYPHLFGLVQVQQKVVY
jgi:hypothetical protein